VSFREQPRRLLLAQITAAIEPQQHRREARSASAADRRQGAVEQHRGSFPTSLVHGEFKPWCARKSRRRRLIHFKRP